MSTIFNILLSVIVSVAGAWGVYNYAPLNILEVDKNPVQTFGSTITTIAGTDTLSNSRTTINNNFTSLNNGKVENATTSMASLTTLANLATVGTITSGTWSGTTIAVAKGGTGSTTPTGILYGNGAGAYNSISNGTTGYFLTSNGAGSAPTFQSAAIDTAANYTWTGLHTFSGSTTTISSATTTLTSATSIFGVGTTTPMSGFVGILNGLNEYIAGGLGIGIATTSPGNLVVKGLASTTNLIISGTQTGGSMSYTASSTIFSVSTGAVTYTGSIPSYANKALIQIDITDGTSQKNHTEVLARTGLTTATVGNTQQGTVEDGTFTLAWSGNDFVVTETVDDSTDSSITGTAYWYR